MEEDSRSGAVPALPLMRGFRVGTTSYVYPDAIVPNVERLAGRVEDVELVLFESGGVDALPDPAAIERLAALQARHGHSYTVHFAIDRAIGSGDPGEREAFLVHARRAIERTRPLRPFAFILHLAGIDAGARPREVDAWRARAGAGIERLLEAGAAPERLAVENTEAPFEWSEPLVERYGLSVCLDVGHVWLHGEPVETVIPGRLPRTRVVHLHGERDGRDHLSLAAMDRERLRAALALLRGFTGVLTIEVFSYEETASSIRCLGELLG